MEEKQTLILLSIYAEKLFDRFKYNIEDVYAQYKDKSKIETIRWFVPKHKDESSTSDIVPFKKALGNIQSHHKKVILFTTGEIGDIIFEESKAKPHKNLEIIINVIDATTRIFNRFKITKYPVEYVFFSTVYENDEKYKTYSFNTKEPITTKTFVEALQNEDDYITLSLKLHAKLYGKDLKKVDFSSLNKIANKKKIKVDKLCNKEELECHIQEIFKNESETSEQQRFLNLKNFVTSTTNKSVTIIQHYKCVNVTITPEYTIIYHRKK